MLPCAVNLVAGAPDLSAIAEFVVRAENLPIVIMVGLVGLFSWLSLRETESNPPAQK